MEESSPRITASHSADESEGGMFGIATHSLRWVVPVVIAAFGLFLILAKQMSARDAALVSLLPAAAGILALRFLQQSGPVGFLWDHVVQLIQGGHASRLGGGGRFRPPLFSPFPDGYISEGLLVFGGLNGCVARGYDIELPDLSNASFAERNRAQEAFSAVLRLLPEGWSFQIRQFEDQSGFPSRLQEYALQTTGIPNPVVRRLRNANLLGLSRALHRGQLRHRRLSFFVGFGLSPGGRDPLSQLTAAEGEFRRFGQTLQQLLAGMGARATPLSSGDLHRQWADAFNPSQREQHDGDPGEGVHPEDSLLESVWHSELRGDGREGFVLDGFHHLGFTLKRLPAETYFSMLHSLASLPFGGVTTAVRLRRLPKEPILRSLQAKVERNHRQRQERPDERLAVAQAQLEDKIRRLTADGVAPLELELIIIVRAESSSDLLDRAAAVKAAIQRMNGAQVFEATLASSSRSLFAKSLPGWMCSGHRGYGHYCEDTTAADLLPVVASFGGHPSRVQALFPGADGGLVNVASFLGEGGAETPQNLGVLGAAGVGKSRAINKALIETAGDFGLTAIVENGLSQQSFTRALGSEALVFKPGGGQTINFLDTNGHPRTPSWLSAVAALVTRMMGVPQAEDRARHQQALILRELVRVTGEHAEECLRRWPAERRDGAVRECAALLRRVQKRSQPLFEAFLEFRELQRSHPSEADAEVAGISDTELREHEFRNPGVLQDLVFAHLGTREQLTLGALQESLELSEDDACRDLAVLLAPWCQGGTYGGLFDGPTNVPMNSEVLHFELGFIPQGARDLEGLVAFAALGTIRDRCLSLPKQVRKRVVIDEVSRFLDVPGGEAILRELFESFRKHNTQVIIIGQQYSRIADSSLRAAIMGNTRAWLLFNTGDAKDIARLGADLGLSQVSVETIRRFPRPDQMPSGPKYSEFLYFHTDAKQPICGAVRYYLLPTDDEPHKS